MPCDVSLDQNPIGRVTSMMNDKKAFHDHFTYNMVYLGIGNTSLAKAFERGGHIEQINQIGIERTNDGVNLVNFS